MDRSRQFGGVSPRLGGTGPAVSPRSGYGVQYASRFNDPGFAHSQSPLITQWSSDLVAIWKETAARLAAEAQVAIAQAEAAQAGEGEGDGEDFQTLADEMGVRPRRAEREQRRKARPKTIG